MTAQSVVLHSQGFWGLLVPLVVVLHHIHVGVAVVEFSTAGALDDRSRAKKGSRPVRSRARLDTVFTLQAVVGCSIGLPAEYAVDTNLRPRSQQHRRLGTRATSEHDKHI